MRCITLLIQEEKHSVFKTLSLTSLCYPAKGWLLATLLAHNQDRVSGKKSRFNSKCQHSGTMEDSCHQGHLLVLRTAKRFYRHVGKSRTKEKGRWSCDPWGLMSWKSLRGSSLVCDGSLHPVFRGGAYVTGQKIAAQNCSLVAGVQMAVG